MKKISVIIAFVAMFGVVSCNKVGDVTPHKFPEQLTGYKPSTSEVPFPDVEDIDITSLPKLKGKAQKSLSYELPHPGKQVNNSCAAWAVAYGMLSYQYQFIKGGIGYNGYNNIFSPSYIYNLSNNNKDEGIGIDMAMQLVLEQGCCKWPYMPGSNSDFLLKPTTEAINNAANFKLQEYHQFHSIDIDKIKSLLDLNFPLIIGVNIDEGFHAVDERNTFKRLPDGRLVWIKRSNIGDDDTHAMMICDYDDKINAFKLLNSWGDSWGNGGFIWVDYNLLSSVIVMEKKVPVNKPAIYLGILDIDSKNVFEGTQSQGFDNTFTVNTSTPYLVTMYIKDLILNIGLDADGQNVVNATYSNHFGVYSLPSFEDAFPTGKLLRSSINNGEIDIDFNKGHFHGFISGDNIDGNFNDTTAFLDKATNTLASPLYLSAHISLKK